MDLSKTPEPIRVLLVEDEFLIRDWIAQALTEQGFAVKTAGNATEALRQIACGPIDVLLTDINLPGPMDGAVLARRMRELKPDLPVIYASARARLLEQGDRVPGSLLLPKPYDPATLVRLLLAAFRGGTHIPTPAPAAASAAALEPA
jgi:DNA-binding response OmpR family regulator